MQTTNISDFRKDLRKYLDIVTDDYETLIINRSNNKAVILMSLDEYNSFMETHYLLSSKANRKHLEESIAEFEQGKYQERNLIEE
ncbi:MAG: type II toxin-antitoxin system prevent-host-death family antitoxin [Bacteroidales bacterium]|nr:type II toxin-antitoxin system prevent-host-death family antitoxin [Bacteroidales bacterium]